MQLSSFLNDFSYFLPVQDHEEFFSVVLEKLYLVRGLYLSQKQIKCNKLLSTDFLFFFFFFLVIVLAVELRFYFFL